MLIYGERDLLATIEHVIPISKGGRDHPNNIKMAHKRCNEKRGSEWPTDRRVAQLTSHDQNRR